jgi:Poly(A) polymerase predicted RNA binding domain
MIIVTYIPKAGAVGPRKLDISWPTTEFTKMVKSWDKYDESKMGIVVRHIKRYHSHPLQRWAYSQTGLALHFPIMYSNLESGYRSPLWRNALSLRYVVTRAASHQGSVSEYNNLSSRVTKAPGRSNNVSPDLPATKKARYVYRLAIKSSMSASWIIRWQGVIFWFNCRSILHGLHAQT